MGLGQLGLRVLGCLRGLGLGLLRRGVGLALCLRDGLFGLGLRRRCRLLGLRRLRLGLSDGLLRQRTGRGFGLRLQVGRLGRSVGRRRRELLKLLRGCGFGAGQRVTKRSAEGGRTGQAHAALLGASLAAAPPDSVQKTMRVKLDSALALSGAFMRRSARICATAGMRVSNSSPISQAV